MEYGYPYKLLFLSFGILYLYHWYSAAANAKEKRMLILCSPFHLFISSAFTEKGNSHRKKALASAIALIATAIYFNQ